MLSGDLLPEWMTGSTMFADEHEFEDEVRRIARLLWPSAAYGGAALEDGRERDGVFESEEFVHLIECTVSRSKQKAIEDLEKLEKLSRKYQARHPQKFVKGWFVTLYEPTADQRSVFRKVQGRIVVVSFDQFRSRLVDARSYLDARGLYPFGSVRDPDTGDATFSIEYVPLDVVDQGDRTISVDELSPTLEQGRRFVLLGDYGAGKSATMQQLYLQFAARFRASKALVFPVLLNLRDHHGQTDPVEALERHARRVGFATPDALVRAWRAGFVVLLLDGFDEVATAGWAGKTKRLKDLRHRSMELVRGFLRETPRAVGMIVAGREHFFDSQREMKSALALDDSFSVLRLSEFSDQQIAVFLGRLGWSDPIPEWVPSRPLLLGYLASRNLLRETLEVEAGSGPASGWNSLLERISHREAEIEAGIDAGTVRRLIEHIATLARRSPDGLGPVSADQIMDAFSHVCGYPPDDRGAVLLQRLPGLGGHSAEDGSRVFIDQDFVAAAQGGAVFEYIQSPFDQGLDPDSWQSALPAVGVDVAVHRSRLAGFSDAKLTAALRHALDGARTHTLAADVFLVMNHLGRGCAEGKVFLREVLIPQLEIEGSSGECQNVELQDCIVGRLELGVDVGPSRLPSFVRCYFGAVEGRTGMRDLPKQFLDCVVDSFEDSAQTTDAILALSLPMGTKVLLTVLKKLYAQRGSGRKESALIRGLDHRAAQLVPEVLNMLRREGLVTRARQGDQTVWLPTKSSEKRRRAMSMLAGPSASKDSLVTESRNLG
jgi:hypothetical protein